MYLSSLECYATAKLNCGVADLCMLDNVYSTLGEDCYDTDELAENYTTLNELLAEAYFQIASRVQDIILDWVEDKNPIEIGTSNGVANIEFTETQVEQITKLAEALTENSPFANCLDTYFQNDLDQTVDWESSAEHNAKELLKYWIENEEIEV